MYRRNYVAICITAAISILIIFFNLGGFSLLDPDEPVYAETPKEMILYNDFISPKIYGEYWYDKPPMYYWLVSLSYKIFGINDFAARFPSALFAVVGIGVIFYFAQKLFNKNVGMISALVLVTSIEYFYLGKAAVTDITLNLFLTCSLLSFISKKYYSYYIFAGLAALTKGPIGLFFPSVIVLIYLIITNNLKELRQMKILPGVIIFSIIALPWYIIMYNFHGNVFIDTFLGFHNVTRFTTPEHPSGTLWYFYIPVLIVGFFPWIAILMQSVYNSLMNSRQKFNELAFLNTWMFVVFLFFSFAQTKLVSYILPMYPPMAIIVGWHIDQLCKKHYENRSVFSWIVLSCVFMVLVVVGSVSVIEEMPETRQGILYLNILLILMMVCILISTWQKKLERVLWVNIIGMCVFSLILVKMIIPAIAPQFSSFNIAQQFKQDYDNHSPIYVSKFLRPGFSFYSNYYGNELIFSDQSIPNLEPILQQNSKVYFILRDIDYTRIPESIRYQLTIIKTVDNKMILVTK